MTISSDTLLILSRSAARYDRLLASKCPETMERYVFQRPEAAREAVRRATIVLGDPDLAAGLLTEAPALRWFQSTFAGVDALLPLPSKRIALTRVEGVFGPAMSEYVFGYVLSLARGLFKARENQVRQVWQRIPYQRLAGRRMGICGMGDIGRHLAKTARHFGMTVWGYRLRPTACPEADRLFHPDEFHAFLAGADVVVVTLPLTPATHGLFDEAAFAAMKPTALLINVGRGPIVSEKALVRAVREGRIGGAVLDVFETEPLPADSPLWTLPEVFITPHQAAVSFAEEIVGIFLENYRRFKAGRPLKYVVDPDRGY